MKQLLLGFLILLQLPLFAQMDDELQKYIEQGNKSYAAGKFGDAERFFEQATNRDPKSFEARKSLADSKHKQEKYEAAITDYDLAEELDDENAEVYLNRGVAKIFMGDFRSAIKDFNQSEELDPNNADLYYYRAYCHSEFNHFKLAIADYSKCIQLDPDNAGAYYNRGAAIAEMGNYEAGMKDFEAALKKDPDLEGGKINIALTKLGMEQYEKAIDDFNDVIEVRDENLGRAYFYRGEARYELGLKEEACSDWEKASNLNFPKASEFVNDFCSGKQKVQRREIDIVF